MGVKHDTLLRTVQHDLNAVESHLPLICHEGDGEHRWSLSSSFSDVKPGLDTPTVLTSNRTFLGMPAHRFDCLDKLLDLINRFFHNE